MRDVPDFKGFARIEPVDKGWSGDKKYFVCTNDGRHLLLRVAPAAEYERKKAEFEMMGRVAALGVPMSQPVDFGRCCEGESVYQLLTWCEGEDAEDALPRLAQDAQYALGAESGRILRKIHAIPAPEGQEDWAARFNRKTDVKIEKYRACGIRFDGDTQMIAYVEANRHLLQNRPQCYQHGDYHVGNMIVGGDGSLSIIDFNRNDFGDPWEEFNRIVWSAQAAPAFATGQLDGYFGGRLPEWFFGLLAFYISSNMLSSIYWAQPFGQDEVDTMLRQSQDVREWFDDMANPVPSWYRVYGRNEG